MTSVNQAASTTLACEAEPHRTDSEFRDNQPTQAGDKAAGLPVVSHAAGSAAGFSVISTSGTQRGKIHSALVSLSGVATLAAMSVCDFYICRVLLPFFPDVL